jgi:hypothetical protein
MTLSELFGFLDYPHTLEFNGGRIEPVPDYNDGFEYIMKFGNRDGYIYPPMIKSVELDPSTMEPLCDIPNSEKPAPLFSLPASHSLTIESPPAMDNLRYGDAGLLVHLIAFFFGTRLQFSDWRFDGKIPTKRMNSFLHASDVPSSFVSHVYQQWKNLSDELKTRYVNILYMHGKVKSCEWEWDAFIYQYMVFDAIYKFYVLSGNQEIHGHKNRLKGLCKHFEVPYDNNQIDLIYELRNEFFHEALWEGATPGLSLKPSTSFYTVKWLDRLNSRLIVAITGYRNDYTRSGWWFFGWEPFGKFS